MKLQQLRYLVAIVDNGLNITAASQALFTSQPGVSKQVKLLEEELSLQLFLRRGKVLPFLRANGRVAVAAVLLNFGSYGIAIFALSLGAMAPVSALRETSVIIAALIGTLVLKEPFGPVRVAAACAVALGVVVMNLGR